MGGARGSVGGQPDHHLVLSLSIVVNRRTLSVGERLNGDRAEATYTNGILRVQLAAGPEAAPRKIAIQR